MTEISLETSLKKNSSKLHFLELTNSNCSKGFRARLAVENEWMELSCIFLFFFIQCMIPTKKYEFVTFFPVHVCQKIRNCGNLENIFSSKLHFCNGNFDQMLILALILILGKNNHTGKSMKNYFQMFSWIPSSNNTVHAPVHDLVLTSFLRSWHERFAIWNSLYLLGLANKGPSKIEVVWFL